jgi:hypothetical protein
MHSESSFRLRGLALYRGSARPWNIAGCICGPGSGCDAGAHRAHVLHRTGSPSNPYVVITTDAAALRGRYAVSVELACDLVGGLAGGVSGPDPFDHLFGELPRAAAEGAWRRRLGGLSTFGEESLEFVGRDQLRAPGQPHLREYASAARRRSVGAGTGEGDRADDGGAAAFVQHPVCRLG